MDIIASHQQGLVEILSADAQALGGGPGDAVQRAMAYHHLADSLRLADAFALLAAGAALRIAPAIEAMRRQVERNRWRLSRGRREALLARVAAFGEALHALDAARCAGALLAYRLVATPGLGQEARRRLAPELIAAIEACRLAEGARSAAWRRRLFLARQAQAEAEAGDGLEAAIAALDWPLGAAPVRAAIALIRIPIAEFDRAEAAGLGAVERRLRRSRAFPASFAANPAQAFYALQRRLAERRRGAPDLGLAPEEAVRLAA